ncbi:hypothetical protein HYFRA_00008800 [Hymenoscyphus fraxineus]|uniref:Uncharacterized protein n=1 Tax=Hymenoscyphus fraxineus TaxID=746836 RepID=A0A9N9KXV6_9HELO|nr:hypothetical protein HYFRA_00008800 [Hymenoscyphus fraxineus]
MPRVALVHVDVDVLFPRINQDQPIITLQNLPPFAPTTSPAPIRSTEIANKNEADDAHARCFRLTEISPSHWSTVNITTPLHLTPGLRCTTPQSKASRGFLSLAIIAINNRHVDLQMDVDWTVTTTLYSNCVDLATHQPQHHFHIIQTLTDFQSVPSTSVTMPSESLLQHQALPWAKMVRMSLSGLKYGRAIQLRNLGYRYFVPPNHHGETSMICYNQKALVPDAYSTPQTYAYTTDIIALLPNAYTTDIALFPNPVFSLLPNEGSIDFA